MSVILTGQERHIYVLRCPDTKEVRYVGQSRNPYARYAGHLNSAKNESNKKALWVRGLKAAGKQPELEVIETVPAILGDAAERRWIEHYRTAGASLLNGKPGGDVRKPRRKLNKVRTSINLTPEARRLLKALAVKTSMQQTSVMELAVRELAKRQKVR